MLRNYSKEANWAKQKYKHFGIKIDKEIGEKLKDVLKANGVEQAAWFKTMALETISKYDDELPAVKDDELLITENKEERKRRYDREYRKRKREEAKANKN